MQIRSKICYSFTNMLVRLYIPPTFKKSREKPEQQRWAHCSIGVRSIVVLAIFIDLYLSTSILWISIFLSVSLSVSLEVQLAWTWVKDLGSKPTWAFFRSWILYLYHLQNSQERIISSRASREIFDFVIYIYFVLVKDI